MPFVLLLGVFEVFMAQGKTIITVSSNTREVISVLAGVVSEEAVLQLNRELERHVFLLLELAEEHCVLAESVSSSRWRQKVSRAYYAAYNARRAVELYVNGVYKTDSSDHKNLHKMPDDFPGKETKVARLRDLREDRNAADYDHLAEESILIMPAADAVAFSRKFLADAEEYLSNKGLGG